VKRLFLFFILFQFTLFGNAQTQLWGLTSYGGQYGAGVIFSTDASGNNQPDRHHLFQNEDAHPGSSLVQASDGKYYGVTGGNAVTTFGILYQYDPLTNIYTKKVNFVIGSNIGGPSGALILASDGKLWGMAGGGTNNSGTIYQYDPVTSAITIKFNFAAGTTTGSGPSGSLLQTTDGKFYGMAGAGGTYNKGTLFQFDPVNSVFTKKVDFDGTTNGANPYGSLIVAPDGRLYGMTSG